MLTRATTFPETFPAALADKADQQFCEQTIRTGSRSFFTASLVLPAALRRDAYALYAFCRFSDDVVDESGGAAPAIDRLRERLERCFAGVPDNDPIDRAFAEMVARTDMPRDLPLALIEGLDWDVQGRRYHDLGGVLDYAARVAGAVGAMMAVLMGVRDAERLARACDLGCAMQLTNIARDIGEDARNGRIYLPLDWFAECGLEPADWLEVPQATSEIRALTERLLLEAERLYQRAEPGIAALPLAYRPGMLAARRIYAEIGSEIAAAGFDSISARARVSGRRKALLLSRSLADAPFLRAGAAGLAVPALPENAYLVAAARDPLAEPVVQERKRTVDQILWAAELFAELEQRDRQGIPRA